MWQCKMQMVECEMMSAEKSRGMVGRTWNAEQWAYLTCCMLLCTLIEVFMHLWLGFSILILHYN